MKILFRIAFLFFILIGFIDLKLSAQNQTVPYRQKKLWGLKRGETFVLQPSKAFIRTTDLTGYFTFYENARWGLLDSNGKVIIPAQYYEIEVYSLGIRVLKNSEAYGLYDFSGKIVLEPAFELIHNRMYLDNENGYSSFIMAEKNGFKGLFDMRSKTWILPLDFKNIDIGSGRFGRKWIAATKGKAFALYDFKGQLICDEKYLNTDVSTSPFPIQKNSKEYCVVQDMNEKYGVINAEGKEFFPCQFTKINFISENKAMFTNDGKKWGFLNISTGKIIIEPTFEDCWAGFKNGFCQAVKKIDNQFKTGFIDTTGNFVIQPKYSFAVMFPTGKAWVLENELGWMIDLKTGKKIHEKGFKGMPSYSKSGYTFSLEEVEKQGFMDLTGKIIIEPKYNSIQDLENGYLIAHLDSEQHLYDFTGKLLAKGFIHEMEGFRLIHDGNSCVIYKNDKKIADLGKKYYMIFAKNQLCEVLDIGDQPINPMDMEGMAPPETTPTLEEMFAPNLQTVGYMDSKGTKYWED